MPPRSFLYPSPRDFVPFVLLLAVVTIFNADTVLSLKLKNIDLDRDQAGVPAIQVVGEKGRAVADLVRLLDPDAPIASTLTVRELFLLLIRFTKRIRKHAILGHREALFLYVPLIRAKRVKSYGNPTAQTGGESSDETWKHSLERFVADHALEPFTLGQIRPSILELIHEADGSLDAAARAANHKFIKTTWTHYTSSRIRKNYRQRIGEVLLLRERWFVSKGRIDPRGRQPTENKGAATPGFLCLDPFDSPRPSQKKNHFCSAYGACPSCELSAARPNDPYSVACYVGLERAIRESLTSMTAVSWRTRWAPVLADLKSLLKLIPATVMQESKNFGVKLPKVE